MIHYVKRIVFLFLLCGLSSSCKPGAVVEPSSTPALIFDLNLEEYREIVWGVDKNMSGEPYVMWVKIDDQLTCNLPLYRTGYPVDWSAFTETVKDKVETSLKIGVCKKQQDRCYLITPEVLGGGLTQLAISKEEACSDDFEYRAWE